MIDNTRTEPSPSRTSGPHTPRRSVLIGFGTLGVIGLVFFAISFRYPLLIDGEVGPGLLPRLSSAGLILLSILLLRDEFGPGSRLEGDGADQPDEDHTPAQLRATRKKLIIIGAIVVGTVVLVPLLGLLPATAVMAFVLSAFVERMPKITAALIAVSAFVATFVLFVLILRVPVPFGIFDPALWRS